MMSFRCALLVCGCLLTGTVLPAQKRDAPAKRKRPLLPKDTLPKTLDLQHVPRGLSRVRPVPKDSPLTAARVRLGRRLFFDGVLSANGTVSCASCHQPDHGFAAPDPLAVGIHGQLAPRNAPSVLNRAYGKTMFWDGRAASLEEQALQPIANKLEMGSRVEDAVARLRADATYVKQFQAAFAPDAKPADVVTAANLARALGSFQRTLLLGDTPIDRFRGGDAKALSNDERQGLWLFESKGRCWKCHSGNDFTDEKFHNTGASWGKEPVDLGRFVVTKEVTDVGRFKTPTLRGVALTPPYMHDGSQKTLRDVVEFYNRGGTKNVNLDRDMQPLKLTKREVDQLVAFLKALSRTADEKAVIPRGTGVRSQESGVRKQESGVRGRESGLHHSPLTTHQTTTHRSLLQRATSRASGQRRAAKKVPIILDTDIGTDVDDAFALGLAATSPELDLLGVTTVAVKEDGYTRAMIACRFLYAIGRDKVPVAAGERAGKPHTNGQFQYGLRPARKRPVKEGAVEFLYQRLKARPGEITLVAAGPLSNVAALIRKHPDCKMWIKRLVIMGGSVRVGYSGKAPAEPEWNITSDVKAAKTVFASGVPLVVAPLDATTMLRLDEKLRGELFAAGIRVTSELRILFDLWNRPTPVLYDPVAVTLCFTERFCKLERLRLEVDDKGATREVKGQPNARVATGIDRDAFLRWYVDRMTSREMVVHLSPDAKPVIGRKPVTEAALAKTTRARLKHNPQLTIRFATHPKTPAGTLSQMVAVCQKAGAKRFVFGTSRRRSKPTNVVKPVPQGGFPNRVHVVEDYQTDIERRWWLAGRVEAKNAPPSTTEARLFGRRGQAERGAEVGRRRNRGKKPGFLTRVCRATLTHNFDARMGDPTQLYRAVIFNPVPGPPMGPRTRLSFRYRLKGTDTLRVQIYTLSKGYHRFLTLTGLPTGKWRSATVDMTQARRPDGSGGPLSQDERIDDIQFYAAPDAELLIDDVILYDAAEKAEKRPFPRRMIFTGWFDTGRQGREWPGDFQIVPHAKPRTWKAAESVTNQKTGRPWIRLSLRGLRALGKRTAVRFLYRYTGKRPFHVVLVNSRTGRKYSAPALKPGRGDWGEATVEYTVPMTAGKPALVDELRFELPEGARLQVDDVLIYEPE